MSHFEAWVRVGPALKLLIRFFMTIQALFWVPLLSNEYVKAVFLMKSGKLYKTYYVQSACYSK